MTKVLSSLSMFSAAQLFQKKLRWTFIRKNIIFRAINSVIDTLYSREFNEAQSFVDCHKKLGIPMHPLLNIHTTSTPRTRSIIM